MIFEEMIPYFLEGLTIEIKPFTKNEWYELKTYMVEQNPRCGFGDLANSTFRVKEVVNEDSE